MLAFSVSVFLSTKLTTFLVDAVCNYPLSAACCLNRICSALEQKWNIGWMEILRQNIFVLASSIVFFSILHVLPFLSVPQSRAVNI